MNNIAKKRIDWIDAAKGLGIFFVVWGHITYRPSEIDYFIYSFHMPLFFFLTGLFVSADGQDLGRFLVRKMKSLLLPYYFFSAITFVVFYLLSQIGITIFSQALEQSSSPFVLLGHSYAWFLPCCFLVDMLLFFVLSLDLKKIQLLIVISLLLLGLLTENQVWPFHLNVACVALFFAYMGHILKPYLIGQTIKSWHLVLAIMIFLVAVYFQIDSHVHTDMMGALFCGVKQNFIKGSILFVAGAISGIIVVISLSKFLRSIKVLAFFGANSLCAYLLQWPVVLFVSWGFFHLCNGEVVYPLAMSFLAAIFAMTIIYPCIYLVNRFFPFLLGRES